MKNFIWAGVLAAATLALPAHAETEQLNMGGSSTTSGYYPYYTAVANAISATETGLNVTVVSAGGFAKNVQLMASGTMDFGGVSPDLIQEQIDRGNDFLRVLWWVNPAIQNIMVRKDKAPKDLSGLSSLCFHPGMTGSSTQKAMGLVMKTLGLTPKLYLSDPADAANAIKDGRCDGQVKSITGNQLDAATAELNLSTPMWPVGYSKAEQDKVKNALPWISFVDVAPGIVKDAPAYTTHALWVGFAAPKSMNEETAYQVMKGMWAGIEAERVALKPLQGVDVLARSLTENSYPLHPGAIRFYREMGLDVPEALIPPEMKK
jgi:TRAP transporter TAXI family solute receptor